MTPIGPKLRPSPEAVTATVINPAVETGPQPEAVTAPVRVPKTTSDPMPPAVTAPAATPKNFRKGIFPAAWDYWNRLGGRFGAGLAIGYLASLGPGDRYLYTPVFLVEGFFRLPLNPGFLAKTERNAVSAGIETGYYGSSTNETREDQIRGKYLVSQDLRVVPLYLNCYYQVPFSPLLSISVGVGLGVSFASLDSSYDTPFFSNDEYESISDSAFSYQFIGRGHFRTGSIGEAVVELRSRHANFSPGDHPESEGDLGGLSFGAGYNFLF